MWYWIFYLVAMADNLSNALLTIWIIAGIIAFIAFLFWTFRDDEGDLSITDRTKTSNSEDESRLVGKRSRMIMRLFVTLFVVCLTFFLLIPDRDSLILIVAGGTVGQFLEEDENAREIPSEIFELLRAEITKEITEIRTETIKSEVEKLTTEQMKEELIRLRKEVVD